MFTPEEIQTIRFQAERCKERAEKLKRTEPLLAPAWEEESKTLTRVADKMERLNELIS